MRVTQNSMNRTQMMGLNDSLSRLQRTQEQLTSGKRLVRPSDSPVDTVSAMRLKDQQRTLSALGGNIADGLARMQSADDALSRSSTMLTQIRTLVVAGANGVNGPEQRGAYAKEIEQIRGGMIQLANTKYAGQSLFGGTSTAPNAFDPATGKFLGNSDPVLRKVTEAQGSAGDLNIGMSGATAFGASGTSTELFGSDADITKTGLIDRVIRHLTSSDPADQAALQTDLADLDAAAEALSSAAATVGARVNRLNQLEDLNGRLDDSATVALSKLEDVDFVKAAMDLQIQSNAYNAALQASAKIIQPSLMDFLR